MKKIIILGFVIAFLTSLLPLNAFAAASFSVYISPASSSVVNGNNVSVSVRVSPNGNSIDSIQASLNFDSSKLQYLSFSGGAFTTFNSGAVGGTFNYTGMLLGSSISSDSAIFTVSFKAIGTGTASLSVSGVSAAFSGESVSYGGSNTGSVTISTPVNTPPSTNTPPTTYTPPVSNAPVTTTDKIAPKLLSDPAIKIEKNNIIFTFNTDEESKIKVVYYNVADKKYSLDNDILSINHEINIGGSEALIPGTSYTIEITAVDKLGNSGVVYSQSVRTEGLIFKMKITDLDGNPLVNHPVQIFSDPKSSTTDADGFVTFDDMTPGEHTLVFEVDGLTLRQPVVIRDTIEVAKSDSTAAAEDYSQIKLPVRFAFVDEANLSKKESSDDNKLFIVALVSALLGAIIMFVFNLGFVKNFFNNIANKLFSPKGKNL